MNDSGAAVEAVRRLRAGAVAVGRRLLPVRRPHTHTGGVAADLAAGAAHARRHTYGAV